MKAETSVVRAYFPISILGLARHMGEPPESAIQIVSQNPLKAELTVGRLLRNYLWAIKSAAIIPKPILLHLDSGNITHAIAYFDLALRGIPEEITKVFKGGFILKLEEIS